MSEAASAKELPNWLPTVGALAVRTIGATWRLRSEVPPELDPRRTDRSRRFVYLIWHRTILVACHAYRDHGICVGVSQHRDGEIGARIAEKCGFTTARGSSTRGGVRLLLEMIDAARAGPGDLALTPDGPKGPVRRTKPGALFLAARLGWPVVPIAMTARPRKRLPRSWDDFVLPLPFAKVASVAAEPLEVPERAAESQLEQLCREVDARMAKAEAIAEELCA